MARNGASDVDVIVVGGGPAGLTAAIALAASGVETALVAKRLDRPDNRTTALLASSVAALDVLGVWPQCREQSAGLTSIRLVDDTSRLVRAPEVTFAAAEIGLEAFGYNIENRHLVTGLEARADRLAHLTRIDEAADAIDIDSDEATVRLTDGRRLAARLVVGADGRKSLCRTAAGIEMTTHSYPQAALTLNFSHGRPHHGVSTEFHTETGPFTLVPLPAMRSSLICVVEPGEAQRLAKLDPQELSEKVEQRSHSILGKVTVEPGRGVFPLAIESATRLAADRIALIGEAAHVLPPIGAQGLNLGLRDAAAISEIVVAARRAGDDIGSDDVLERHARLRHADVASRTVAVDMLNRTLLTDFLPIQGARGAALYLIDRIGPLRRALMREGVAPSTVTPRLMRGEPL